MCVVNLPRCRSVASSRFHNMTITELSNVAWASYSGFIHDMHAAHTGPSRGPTRRYQCYGAFSISCLGHSLHINVAYSLFSILSSPEPSYCPGLWLRCTMHLFWHVCMIMRRLFISGSPPHSIHMFVCIRFHFANYLCLWPIMVVFIVYSYNHVILDFHDMIMYFLIHIPWDFASIRILLWRHSVSYSPDVVITPCNVVIHNSSTAKDCLVLQQTSILVGIGERRISKLVCNLLAFSYRPPSSQSPVSGTIF